MTFTEDWFGTPSQEALADLARTVKGLVGGIVEIGSWEGRSTVALANACHPEVVNAVDHWHGSLGEISSELAAERDIYATFTANIAELTAGNVDVHRMGWRDYFNQSAPLKLVFIDAEHSYQEVRDNIEAVLPLMVAGGIICGDDSHHPPIQWAVVDTLGGAGLVATLWWWQK